MVKAELDEVVQGLIIDSKLVIMVDLGKYATPLNFEVDKNVLNPTSYTTDEEKNAFNTKNDGPRCLFVRAFMLTWLSTS